MLKPLPDRSTVEQISPFGSRAGLSVLARLVAVLVCSQLFALDWIGNDGWWMTWLAMSGFVAVSAYSKPWAASLFGLLFGVIALGTSFWWAKDMLAYVINDEGFVPKLVFALLITWESLLLVIVGLSISVIRLRNSSSVGLLVPIGIWIVGEAYLPRVFRWTLGHSQLGLLEWVQTVDLGGASLVSLIVLAAAAIPTLLWDSEFWRKEQKDQLEDSSSILRCANRSRQARRSLVVCCCLLLVSFCYGFYRLKISNEPIAATIRMGVVQEDPAYREGLIKMRSRSLEMPQVDLLVWPESTLGIHSIELTSFADSDQVFELSTAPMISPEPLVGLPAPVILGGRSFEGDREAVQTVSQSAFIVGTDGSIIDRYHKRSLMPLGEYVPLEHHFPWLHDWFQLGEYFKPGTSDAPVSINGKPVGIIICYEDTMSEIVRRTVRSGAEVLVCIINDSAFESPTALRQHLKLSKLRAIENRRSLVRSAGTGISCVIDPKGRIEQQIDVEKAGAFETQVPLSSAVTLFQILGNWPPMVIGLALIGYFSASFFHCSRSCKACNGVVA